jgi:hypothetical protein
VDASHQTEWMNNFSAVLDPYHLAKVLAVYGIGLASELEFFSQLGNI